MGRSDAQTAFEALSDPTRRRILHLLAENDETTAGALAEAIQEVGRTAISSHLRVLRSADLVVERREGRYRYYSLHPNGPVLDALGFLQSILAQGASPATASEDRGLGDGPLGDGGSDVAEGRRGRSTASARDAEAS